MIENILFWLAAFGWSFALIFLMDPNIYLFAGLFLTLALFTNFRVVFAIFRRNFTSYFTSPTGYVFICLFVLLAAVGQFMPDAFFTDNLDNLDQFNHVLPLIMLLFVPAVTMGVWSEERREGTDELLLTMPASDVDVILGKYMAALGIFTVALTFSRTNLVVLTWLGEPDVGVLTVSYIGYWLVGAAMISIGMAASFLTRNLTVAFVLGLVLNVPLVALAYSDSFVQNPEFAAALTQWSIGEKFRDFSNGVLSISSVAYFLLIPAVMLYLAMVLIGRRHWSGALRTEDGRIAAYMYVPRALIAAALFAAFVWINYQAVLFVWSRGVDAVTPGLVMEYVGALAGWAAAAAVSRWFVSDSGEHYLVRVVSLAVVAGALVVVAGRGGVRQDWSQDQLSALSPKTLGVLSGLGAKEGWAGKEVAADRFNGVETLSSVDGAYVGATLRFTQGPLEKAKRKVVGYIGATRTFELNEPLPQAPGAGEHFVLERPPVVIDAFLSPRSQTPKEYLQTRLNLENALREIQASAGGLVTVKLHPTEMFSEEAAVANDQYGITPRKVQSTSRGTTKVEDLFLGLAVVSGTQKVTIPFVDRGVPVEYEVVRAIATVAQQQKKRIGVATTDVKLFSSFNMQTMRPTPDEAFISELQKQYDVVQIDLAPKDANDRVKDQQLFEEEIADLDALVAVQPSSMGPDQLERFLKAVRTGVPTAIFEDPFPYIDPSVPGSSPLFQRQAPGGGNPMMGGMQPPPPKADVNRMWTFLGVNSDPDLVIAQQYNPYPLMREFPPEFVFIGKGEGAKEPFNPRERITEKLQELLFLFPGAVSANTARKNIKFTPLVRTGPNTGTVRVEDITERNMFGQPQMREDRNLVQTNREYVLAARVSGDLPAERMPMQGEAVPPAAAGTPDVAKLMEAALAAKPKVARSPRTKNKLNAVVVCDIDILYSVFFSIRDRGRDPNAPINLDVDNVTFVLNILDDLSGDDRFLDIRNRRRTHRTLTVMEEWVGKASQDAAAEQGKFRDRRKEIVKELKAQFDKEVDDIRKRNMDETSQMQALQMAQQSVQQRLKAEEAKSALELERETNKIDRIREMRIREMQASVKVLAITQAPIIPLFVAMIVFFWRRSRETEGVSKNRLV